MVAISITKGDVETLSVAVHLSGLAAGTRYDVMRLQLRGTGKDRTGVRTYERELPDRRGLWSSVAHRVGWEAPAATANFRDYEAPKRPFQYFIVPSASEGPHEFDFTDNGRYPLGRGVLCPDIVHFSAEIADLGLDEDPDDGHVLVRSVHELSHFAEACVVELSGPTYTARTTEHAVMGSQFPVLVSDSRESRRGSMVLMTRSLSQLNALRRVVYPASGRITPFIVNAGGDNALLLDDLRAVALDVELEQVSPTLPQYRYVHISYVEIDPSAPLIARTGDNDSLVSEPQANFNFSDSTPAVGQWVTITDASSGAGDTWEFVVDGVENNKFGRFQTQGPHTVRWMSRGQHAVKLRFGGSGAGFHSRTKTVTVH